MNKEGVLCGGALSNSAIGCGGIGYGGQNSYGHNDAWLSPAGAYNGAGGQPSSVALAAVPRVAGTILITDATYYGALPDVTNQSGLTVLVNLNAVFGRQSAGNYKVAPVLTSRC